MKNRIRMILFLTLLFQFLPCCNSHISHTHGLDVGHRKLPSRLLILDNVIEFCEANGKKYLSMMSINDDRYTSTLMSLTHGRKMYFTTLKINEALEKANIREIEDKIILVNYQNMKRNQSLVQDIVGLISKSKIRSCVLVISTFEKTAANDSINLEPMIAALSILQQNVFFYMVYNHQIEDGSEEYLWNQVITLQNNPKVILNQLEFDSNYRIQESYDLQGIRLKDTAISWAPDYVARDCDSEGKNCRVVEGVLPDLINAIAPKFNFTWETLQPPDGNWGVFPKSGPFNLSGIWHGVMGGVVNGDFHMSLSQWLWNLPRRDILDFVTVYTERMILALTPSQPTIDMGLFIRCFRDDAWYASLIIICLVIVSMLIPILFLENWDNSDSVQISATSGWYFFVLLNAFYGGALTMFFASEAALPFDSIRGVMREYPGWKLMMLNGYDVYFAVPAEQGDPDYVKFWERVQNKREETVYNAVGEGLTALKEGQAVIHISERMLKRYFLERPYIQQPIKVFAKGKPEFKTIIVTLNSPLKPIFEFGIRSLMQGGSSDRVLSKWEGPELVEVPVETMVLNFGQVILGFMITGLICFMAVLSFLFELFWKRYKDDLLNLRRSITDSNLINYARNIIDIGDNNKEERLLFQKRNNLEKRLLRSVSERNDSYI